MKTGTLGPLSTPSPGCCCDTPTPSYPSDKCSFLPLPAEGRAKETWCALSEIHKQGVAGSGRNSGALCLNVISATALANNLETPFSSKLTVHFRVSDDFETVQGLGRWLSQRSVCFVSMKTHVKPPEPTLKTRYGQLRWCTPFISAHVHPVQQGPTHRGVKQTCVTGHAATLHPQDAGVHSCLQNPGQFW